MDADDIAMPDRFERQATFLDANPDHVLVGSRILLIDPDGHPMCALGIKETHEEIDAWHMEGHSGAAICNPTIMMRTQAARDVGGYEDGTACAEDYDLFLRLAEVGKLATLPDVLLHYRQHLSSVGYKRNLEQRNAIRLAVQKAYERRKIKEPVRMLDEHVPNRNAAYAYRQWVEWSLRGGNMGTARRYAWKAIGVAPWSPRAWRSFARAWIKRPAV
jgi:GT2 family glycosyltransferase